METMIVAPNVAGMVRYLRALYLEDRTRALSIVEAGWNLPPLYAAPLLSGEIELGEALARFADAKAASTRSKLSEIATNPDARD